jgi:hypothetical protein
VFFFLCVTEFINTKGPESDGGSSTKVQNEPAAEINNSKADTNHMPPADVPGMAATLFWCAKGHKDKFWACSPHTRKQTVFL